MIYWIVRFFVRIFFRLVGRWRVEGLENVPAEGPVIVAVNHISMADPPIVGASLRRKGWFMAKEELFKPGIGWFISKIQAFPIKRGKGDLAALKKSLGILARGEVLVIFPEGTRQEAGELGPPEIGVGMIALRSGAPVVPARITGTNQLLPKGSPLPRFTPVSIRYGRPITIRHEGGKPGHEDYAAAAREIMEAIARLPA